MAGHRPVGFSGALDAHLPRVRSGLVKALTKAQKDFQKETLKLRRPLVEELASTLVDFGEDVHCDIGIWRGLEQLQQEFFGTPLPFALKPGAELPHDQIAPERVQHFLWVLYPQLKPDLILTPSHVDLIHLAGVAARFLQEQFQGLPKDSGVKEFLGTPNAEAWKVKRKLVWLGTRSYLFRLMFAKFAEEPKKCSDIATIDDFVCQICTEWSGLGALDILARVLSLPPGRRDDLLSWYERHLAVYQVLSSSQEVVRLRNLVNDQTYHVRIDLPRNVFTTGMNVIGSLVPWNGEWVWSGQQSAVGDLGAKELEALKDGFRKLPSIAYRYCKEDLKIARKSVENQYREFVSRHGKDWVVFPDGPALAADWQEAARRRIEALPESRRKQVMEQHGLTESGPIITLPADLQEGANGIGVYCNPEVGQEIMGNFNFVVSGLKRRGIGLTPDESSAIRAWIRGKEISPAFVRSLVAEFGSSSIETAFLLDKQSERYSLDYLLRRYKGVFYRTKYPSVTLVH
jgi:uncharacterized protein DUF3843